MDNDTLAPSSGQDTNPNSNPVDDHFDSLQAKPANVYCDGGVIRKNPSVHGGTWACIFVNENNEQFCFASGLIFPSDIGLPAVSNNLTELLAAVQALELLPDDWASYGCLLTDSHVTRCRLTGKSPGMAGIPTALANRMWAQRERLGAFAVILLDGHPTRAQLAAGVGKRGAPVSAWNVACDRECGRLAEEWCKTNLAESPIA